MKGLVKYYLLFVNTLFTIFALLMFSVGILIQSTFHGASGLFGASINVPSSLSILLGFLFTVTSLLAFLGISFKSSRTLSLYSYVLLLLVIAELSVGISGFVFKSHMLKLITNSMSSTEAEYTKNNITKDTWDFIQQNLQCCGVHNHSEWFHYLGKLQLPDSCCLSKNSDCGRTAISDGNFQKTPCSNTISKLTRKNSVVAAVLLPTILILEIFSALGSKIYQHVLEARDLGQ